MRKLGTITLSVLILLGIGFYFLNEYNNEKEREDKIWRARLVLEQMKTDKTFGYLRLDSIKYNNNQLQLTCISNINLINLNNVLCFFEDSVKNENGETRVFGHASFSMKNIKGSIKDSLMRLELTSLVSIAPNVWDSVFKVLVDANVDMSVTYSNYAERPTIVIPFNELQQFQKDKRLLDRGLLYFIKRKETEVLEYAKGHFKADRFLKADSVSVKNGYVSLYMSYDDSKYKIGNVFLDSKHINPHFTDIVGDMGSILDGMLTICSKTGDGIEFVYIGNKKHKVERCRLETDIIKELILAKKDHLFIENRKTNRVRSVITTNKKSYE